jgi:hypothetical protein
MKLEKTNPLAKNSPPTAIAEARVLGEVGVVSEAGGDAVADMRSAILAHGRLVGRDPAPAETDQPTMVNSRYMAFLK